MRSIRAPTRCVGASKPEKMRKATCPKEPIALQDVVERSHETVNCAQVRSLTLLVFLAALACAIGFITAFFFAAFFSAAFFIIVIVVLDAAFIGEEFIESGHVLLAALREFEFAAFGQSGDFFAKFAVEFVRIAFADLVGDGVFPLFGLFNNSIDDGIFDSGRF